MNAASAKWDHAEYLEKLIRTDELKEQVTYAAEILKAYDFDTIAFSGVSGTLISVPTALAMNKHMLLVRKPSDVDNHSSLTVEGNVGTNRYVIMDDLVCSGTTRRRIMDAIAKAAPDAKCIGMYTVFGQRFRENSILA